MLKNSPVDIECQSFDTLLLSMYMGNFTLGVAVEVVEAPRDLLGILSS